MTKKLISLLLVTFLLLALLPFSSQASVSQSSWSAKGDFANNATLNEVTVSGTNSTDDASVQIAKGVNYYNSAVVAAGRNHSVGLKEDGTVVATGWNQDGQINVGGWTNIKALAAGWYHTVGLKTDGTAVATGWNFHGQTDVSSWSGLKQVAAGQTWTIGLKNDGTVVAVGFNDQGQTNVSSWTNIKSIATGSHHTVGLKENGTVVATGKNTSGQTNISSWSNIKAIAAAGNDTYGLKEDGTVVAVGSNEYGQTNISSWSNIKAIAAGVFHVLGLKNDGTVVAVGWNNDGQTNVGGWSGMSYVAAGCYHSLGIKNDGTALAVGWNDKGQTNVAGFTNIKRYDYQYSSSGTISAKIDAGNQKKADWKNIYWNGSAPANTSIKFRTRGAKSESALSSAAWSSYYTTSGSAIKTPDSKWLEVEAVLQSSDGVSTPTLSDFRLTYNKYLNRPKLTLKKRYKRTRSRKLVILSGTLKDKGSQALKGKKIAIKVKTLVRKKKKVKGKIKITRKWIWKTIKIVKTNIKGKYSYKRQVRKTLNYRAFFAGNNDYAPVYSKAVKVKT